MHPWQLGKLAKSFAFTAIDTVDVVLNRRPDMVPPRRLQVGGYHDFERIGQEFMNYFVDLGCLEPDHAVLDIGCGVGRMAVPLTRFLSIEGSYVGFDILRPQVEWCQKKITATHPNFSFFCIDLKNNHYKPGGAHDPSVFEFPFEDRSFDFVFATSVFTHLQAEECRNYLQEIDRVLRPGRRALLTFFLLNEESRQGMQRGESHYDFRHRVADAFVVSRTDHGMAVAYEEKYLREVISRTSLRIVDDLHYGSWGGRRDYLSFQDIIIVEETTRTEISSFAGT